MSRSPLEDVVANGLCAGCGACVSAMGQNRISMGLTAEGFLRPSTVDLTQAEVRIFDDVCPGQSVHGNSKQQSYHPLWGPVRDVATGYAVDAEVRFKGSSGGVLTALSIGLVESGEVEFVVTNSADPDDPIGNLTDSRYHREALISSAGSRYGPSSPLEKLETYLASGKRFAFIGKPCDVAGLSRMAKIDPRIDQLIPYRMAFFCAGVPSRRGTEAVLDSLGVTYEDCKSFQYRGDGWPGLARARRHDGSEASMDYNSSWGNILNRHLQFRCKICPDGIGEFADLVCADAWYGEGGYPDFTERDGRSLIVSRTEAGQMLLNKAVEKNWIAVTPIEIDEISKMQPYQVSRKKSIIARASALYFARGVAVSFKNLSLMKLFFRDSFLNQMRNLYGTYRRSKGKFLS